MDPEMDQTLKTAEEEDAPVLPERYKLNRHSGDIYSETSSDIMNLKTTDNTESIKDREEDLTKAINWVRHEILLLKEQDKSLLRQFLDLRSAIHTFRTQDEDDTSEQRMSRSGDLDYSQQNGNYLMADRSRCAETYPNPSLLKPDDYLGQFRERTVSLLVPRKTDCPIECLRRERSKEYL